MYVLSVVLSTSDSSLSARGEAIQEVKSDSRNFASSARLVNQLQLSSTDHRANSIENGWATIQAKFINAGSYIFPRSL